MKLASQWRLGRTMGTVGAAPSLSRRASIAAAAALVSAGCASRRHNDLAGAIRVWAHQGQEAEHRALLAIGAAFNQAHSGRLRAELSFFPDFQYTEKVAIAAAAQDMPDAFEIDGPLVARFADAGLLAPLQRHLAPEELEDFLPTIRTQGTVGQQLYALGAFDSGMLLYFDRLLLDQSGIQVPPEGRGFSWDELESACSRLKRRGLEPLALHMNETADEWFTYAFSPIIWSGGGSLIDADGREVRGVLASPANVHSLRRWQGLFRAGYAATDPIEPDPFGRGQVALDWSGHWMMRSHLKRKGARLGVMPLPHLSEVAAAPCGSWCWAVSAHGDQEPAVAWLRWVTDAAKGILPLVRANGAIPARRSAFAALPEYERLPYSLLRRQLEQSARPRPRTPFYATLTQRFAAALRDIARGAEVAGRLKRAEEEIARVIDRRLGPRAQVRP